MKKIILSLLFTVIAVIGLKGQQDAQYTQYMYNTVAVNPAYAGSRGLLSLGALHRSQWLGLEGAPSTQTLTIHTPMGKNIGGGLSVVNDQIGNGTRQETYIDAVFSYTLHTSESGKLSFGIKAGGHLLNIDLNKLENYRPELNRADRNDIDNKFSPNFGVGVYYHTNRFYLGLSAPNILETMHYDDSEGGNSFLSEERMNLYIITGYIFDLKPALKFKPAILVKRVSGAPIQVDTSANFMINDRFILGAAYRWGAAFSGLFGFKVSDKFMLGLAYDQETTQLGGTAFSSGSFEVLLRYELMNKYKKVIVSRFF